MRGHTLVELLLVLTLLGATAASLAPTAGRYRDRAAVTGAREALVGLLADARARAMEDGEAWVHIAAGPWTAGVTTPDTTLRTVRFEEDFGVELELNGGQAEVVLRYDALGIGQMAGQTVRFRRARTVAELVVSGYGRVRRR